MAEGVTCYEMDGNLCDNPECAANGCILRSLKKPRSLRLQRESETSAHHYDIETKLALAINNELCRQIDAREQMDTINVTSKIVALPIVQDMIRKS